METNPPLPQIEWAVAQCPVPGETVSGDCHAVVPHRHGVTLAVIDGIGHGPEAAKAATLAAETLRLFPDYAPLAQLNCCHLALAETRGVVMTLAGFNRRDQSLTLCGVGNVAATLFRAAPGPGTPAREEALLRGGVVGGQLPAPHASTVPVGPGDILVMASDGVRPDFSRELPIRSHLQHLADHLLEKYRKGTDDALVLVARFKEPGDE